MIIAFDGNREYTYDQANRLIAVSDQQSAVSFAYNGDPLHCVSQSIPEQSEGTRAGGARLKQTVNGNTTTYTLDPSASLRAGLAAPLVTVLQAQNAIYGTVVITRAVRYVYGQGDSPLASYDGEDWIYLSGRDGLNSVRQETDAAGNVIAVRSFDPYGVPLGSDGGSPFGFTGEQTDSTGLVFLRARYYDNATGRFLQQDPSRLERHLYLYAESNPIMSIDPTGLCKHKPGDPINTCRVEPGDRLIRIALNNHINPWQKILDWNPQFQPPDYMIHPDNLVWITDPNAYHGPYHLDNFTGYLEGHSTSFIAAFFVFGAWGREQVYDFVTLQRTEFTFDGDPVILGLFCGLSTSLLSYGDSWYVGAYHFPHDPDHNMGLMYGGKSTLLSLGAGIHMAIPGTPLQFNEGIEVAAFASTSDQEVLGFPTVPDISQERIGATIALAMSGSDAVSPRVPFNLGVNLMFLNYDPGETQQYTSYAEMAEDIRSGKHSTSLGIAQDAGGFAQARAWAAEHLIWMWVP